MPKTIKYLAFNVIEKRRVQLGGGAVHKFDKFLLQRGDTIQFRFLIYKDFFNLYTQTGATWCLRIREKRQSTTDLAIALDATFLDASWPDADNIKRLTVKNKVGVFQEGDKIVGFRSGAIGYIIGYSHDTGVIIMQYISGTFADGELIKVVDAAGGYTGVYGNTGGLATLVSGAKISGLLCCEISLETANLNTLLADKEYINCILELEEINSGNKIIGQCDLRINNSFDII